MIFTCRTCDKSYPVAGLDYLCSCGGFFSFFSEEDPVFPSLGETPTPIVSRTIKDLPLFFKLEYLLPTGSFKDRGTREMVRFLHRLNMKEVVEDSSGNAGSSLAAYTAVAKIRCHIYTPAYTSPKKINQMEAYGAIVHRIPGTRDDTAYAVKEAAKTTYYASHVYNPLFDRGMLSLSREIVSAMGIPDSMFVPVGNGNLLLGIVEGFQSYKAVPKIIAVQAKKCAPLYSAFFGEEKRFLGQSIAEGISIFSPPKLSRMVDALHTFGGTVLTVEEEEIAHAQRLLAQEGLYVEMSSAVNLAGALRYYETHEVKGKILLPLTGHGLKM